MLRLLRRSGTRWKSGAALATVNGKSASIGATASASRRREGGCRRVRPRKWSDVPVSQETGRSTEIDAHEVLGGKARVRTMHIAEGFLPAAHAAGWTVAAAPFVIYGARQVVVTVRQHPSSGPLLAAVGAFSFVMSAIKLPSVTGSSSHPTGTGLGTGIFKPPVMAFLGTIVLLFQALLLAHGGITTLGANAFSMAIAGPWAGYGVFCLLRKAGVGVLTSVFALAFVADLFTYVVTSFQLALAFPATEGGFGESLTEFMGVFAITQVPLAVVEGLITVVIVRVLMQVASSELLSLGFLKRKDVPAGAGDEVPADDRKEVQG